MRKFEVFDTCTLFVGTAQEIKVLYKKINKREIAIPVFCDFPKFSESKKTYGLLVDWEDENFSMPSMQVVNGDFIADLVADGEI